ncbi:MAG: TetR/AcrR family transcriptional regulator [Deltaproteobacteria bacterium]|nr:MAG: TetR/AcrR family transcriptional regulator [Deltaproteobacteria bacterium]
MIKPEKRDEIIRAAMELIAEHGFHGAPMALVAERAGVAAGTIYRYFESKDDLIRETHARLEGQILAALTEDYPATQPVRERFLHIGRKLVEYFIASPMEFRFMEQFFNSPYGAAHRREKLFGNKEKSIIFKLFEEALEQQIIKPLPLPVLCALTFGPLVDVCRDHALEFIVLDEALIAQTVAACWDGVKL